MVALLRGINVGRAKRLAMADLRAAAEGLGWSDVSTLLATGNLVFTPRGAAARKTPAQLALQLQHVLERDFALATRVVVLTLNDIETVLREQPFGALADNPSRLMVAAYVDPAARKKMDALRSEDWAPGALSLGQHAAYMWCPDGILESRLVSAVARATRDGLTTRNWSTWLKIHRLALATSTPADGHRSRIVLSKG